MEETKQKHSEEALAEIYRNCQQPKNLRVFRLQRVPNL